MERNQYMAKVFTHITFLRNSFDNVIINFYTHCVPTERKITKLSHHHIAKLSHHQIITSKSPLSPYKLSSFDKFFQCHGLNQLKI